MGFVKHEFLENGSKQDVDLAKFTNMCFTKQDPETCGELDWLKSTNIDFAADYTNWKVLQWAQNIRLQYE